MHIKVSSQCSLKNKQWSDENSVCISFQSVEFLCVGVLHTAVIQNKKQEVRNVTQHTDKSVVNSADHTRSLAAVTWFRVPDTGVRWTQPHPPASVFFLSVLSAICSPLSPHSRSIANPSLGQFTCRLWTKNGKILRLTAAVHLFLLPWYTQGHSG